MRILFIFVPLLFLLTTTSSNAADNYYCDCQSGSSTACVAGKDSNDGLSTSTPKRTLADASSKFSSFFAGDSIQFCRGGSFTANTTYKFVNNNCTSTNTCTVTAYDLPNQQTPQLSHPIITQQADQTLFSFADGGSANHEEGYVFSNLDLRCPVCTDKSLGGGNAFFFYNDIDYVNINNTSIDGFRIGVRLGGGQPPVDTSANAITENITLDRLRIVNSTTQGILGGGIGLVISNSYFENNGSNGVFDHNIYITGGEDISIKNNEFYRSSLDDSGKCNGVSLVVHGKVNNLLIQGNTVHEDLGKANNTCWGIAIDAAYDAIKGPEVFSNVTIKDNKIINVGNVGIGINACVNCIIENNVFVQSQPHGFTAIKAPDRTLGDGDTPQSNVSIINNSIYTATGNTGIVLGTDGTNHTIVNNAVHYTGTASYTCFDFNLAATAYTAIDNNLCYKPNAIGGEWEKGSGDLAAWQAASTSFGANSKDVNPEFNGPTAVLVDLSTSATAIVKAGHINGSLKDIKGKSRGGQPDIGAYQDGAFNPPAKTDGL